MRAITEPSAVRGRMNTACRILAAGGLAVDAYVHADLATRYDPVQQSISEGTLFRVEAGLAALAALLIFLSRRPIAAAFALLVAAGGFALIVVYRYDDVGTLGPLPNMYEPVWFTEKWVAAVAQLVAAAAAGTALLLLRRPRSLRSAQ